MADTNGYQQPPNQQGGAPYQPQGVGYQQPGAGYGQAPYQQQRPGYQPPYQQPPYQQQPQLEQPMSLGEWVVTLILIAIPFVNIIMLIIWTASSSTPTTKKHFAEAELIILAICVVLSIIIGAATGYTVASLVSGTYY